MTQLLLFTDTPAKLSRRSDPITSQQSAAETQPQLGTLQKIMLGMFKVSLWPATSNEAAKEAASEFGGMPESYRKRARELVKQGLIEEAGERKCEVTGKSAMTFRVKEQA
ncbi:MAG: hypothetical protein E6Q97_33725 [Desulfurellales bacterium]|nr:MAG: hypothetical protein E6Q97_33725 [Desulfurellales bacterium]